MSSSLLFLILAALTAVGYLGGRWRAASAAQGDARRLHSRTTYHGLAVGMGAFLAGAATYVLLSFRRRVVPVAGRLDGHQRRPAVLRRRGVHRRLPAHHA